MNEGLIVTVFGIGIVFSFLVLLVGLTTVMSKIVLKYFPEKLVAAPVKVEAGDAEIAVAIAAASRYKK